MKKTTISFLGTNTTLGLCESVQNQTEYKYTVTCTSTQADLLWCKAEDIRKFMSNNATWEALYDYVVTSCDQQAKTLDKKAQIKRRMEK